MSGGFFDNGLLFGGLFDFDHDGHLDAAEAGALGAFAGLYASEAHRAAREAETWDPGGEGDDERDGEDDGDHAWYDDEIAEYKDWFGDDDSDDDIF